MRSGIGVALRLAEQAAASAAKFAVLVRCGADGAACADLTLAVRLCCIAGLPRCANEVPCGVGAVPKLMRSEGLEGPRAPRAATSYLGA